MKKERVTLNSMTESTANKPVDLVGTDPGWGIYLLGHDYPTPELTTQTAGSVDTEGDPVVQSSYANRIITAKVRLFEPSDPATTNFAVNPSSEITTPWTEALVDWAATRVLGGASGVPEAYNGDYLIKHAYDGVGADINTGGFEWASPAAATAVISLYVWIPANYNGGQVYLNPLGWVGSEVTYAQKADLALRDQWQRIWTVIKIVGGDLAGVVRLYSTANPSSAATGIFYSDALQIEAGSAGNASKPTRYFDGDTPGCDFSGARHASTSTRPAPDGTRFSRIYRDLTAQLDRITRIKSGILRRRAPGFNPIIYDLRSAKVTDAPQDIGIGMKRAEVGLAFEALPFGRETERLIVERAEAALPVNIFLAEGVTGDVPALGRLRIEDTQAVDQLAVYWGEQQETYDVAATAELFYQGEALTALGGSVSSALAGASGGTAMKSAVLRDTYQGVLSTNKAGAAMTHRGSYKVVGRILCNTGGNISIGFEWATGDFTNTSLNEDNEVVVPKGSGGASGKFQLLDFGTITLDGEPWEGRIIAKTDNPGGDRIYVDFLMLIPTDEGSGIAAGTTTLAEPSSLTAADGYEQAAGNLTGKTAPIGGVYSALLNSDADDFALNTTEKVAQRTAVSDAGTLAGLYTGRAVGLGSLNLGKTAAAIRLKSSVLMAGNASGLIIRAVDDKNFMVVRLLNGEGLSLIGQVVVAGAVVYSTGEVFLSSVGRLASEWNELIVAAVGDRFRIYFGAPDATSLVASGVASALGTTLAIGDVHLFDEQKNATACIRQFDQLRVWEPTFDQIVFANRACEVLDDRAKRESSDGTRWGKPAYEGDYILVPPSGPERRPTRLITKLSRDPNDDAGIDDQRSKLYVQPRWLMAPPT